MLPLNNKRYASAERGLLFKLYKLYQFRTNKTGIRILIIQILKILSNGPGFFSWVTTTGNIKSYRQLSGRPRSKRFKHDEKIDRI